MDSDDDIFNSLSPPHHSSPPANRRRLKRFKQSATVSTDEISSPFPDLVNPSESPALELEKEEEPRESKGVLEISDKFVVESTDKIFPIESSDELKTFESSEDVDAAGGIEKGTERKERKRALDFGDVDVEFGDDDVGEDLGDLDAKGLGKKMNCEEPRGSKRVLEFDDVDAGFGGNNGVGWESRDSNVEGLDEKINYEEGLGKLDIKGEDKKMESEESLGDSNKEKKNNKKRGSANGGDDGKSKLSKSNKKREEKERKIYLQQLHVESQKLLRETRDASFKPIPVVHKPLSSVLEKIRQRKLELMKKTVGHKFAETNASLKEAVTDDHVENISTEKREADESAKVMQEKSVPGENNSDDFLGNNGLEEASKVFEHEDSPSRMVLDEQPMQAFRAPLDDTQDLFTESQSSEGKEDMSSDQNTCLLEEVFAPSLLAMNLKFDSAPPDDSSSEEEDNDKENVSPSLYRSEEEAEEDDPVKAFVDEEAEEEDDSDNDIRFRENEEEDYEDDEELKDLIATGYEENPIDNDMRNELHQKWLEQQDASGTDNLMQRLKYGSKLKETGLFDDDQENEDDAADDEEFYDEMAERPSKESVARISTRKAKQMIPRMFSDKNDGYLSSDDEELEKKLTKQRLLDKVEKQSTLVSPAEDENSREVFGLIKKLNIVPDTKKKAKSSSIFDKMLTGGRANEFSKPSFVGRKGNHSVPSSHKQGTSTVRSFIFGRDDSNSRSSLSISEDSSDVTMEEAPPRNVTTTKFSSSQFKFSSQITKSASKTTASGPSLFEFLKRSSIQSDAGKVNTTVDLTQTVYAAFKIPKKRIERRF